MKTAVKPRIVSLSLESQENLEALYGLSNGTRWTAEKAVAICLEQFLEACQLVSYVLIERKHLVPIDNDGRVLAADVLSVIAPN